MNKPLRYMLITLLLAGTMTPAAALAPAPQPIIPPAGEYRFEGYGSIPLENYRQIVKFKNACGVLVEDNQKNVSYIEQSTWYGACRWGLIQGSGLILFQGPNATGKFTPVQASNGRVFQLPRADASIPRAGDQPGVYMNAPKPPDPNLLNGYDASPSSILSDEFVTSDQMQTGTSLVLARRYCPVDTKKVSNFSTDAQTMPKVDFASVAKACVNARKNKTSEVYFFVYRIEDRAIRRGHAYSTSAVDGYSNRSFDAKLCPRISSFVGCEVVWQPMRAEYEQRFAKAREDFPSLEALKRAEWNTRFAPWEKIGLAKIAAFLAKGGGQ